MVRRMMKTLAGSRTSAYAAALAAVGITFTCAIAGLWVFRSSTPTRGSVLRLVVADRWALGFLRVAVVALGLYVAASTAALIANGRWIKTVSTAGFEADDRGADERLDDAKARIHELQHERDQAYRLLEEYLNG